MQSTNAHAMVTCNAAFVLFGPTLYSGKLARIWSCTAGFDVITYALVKKKKKFSIAVLTLLFGDFHSCFFLPDETLEQGRNASSSFATI